MSNELKGLGILLGNVFNIQAPSSKIWVTYMRHSWRKDRKRREGRWFRSRERAKAYYEAKKNDSDVYDLRYGQ